MFFGCGREASLGARPIEAAGGGRAAIPSAAASGGTASTLDGPSREVGDADGGNVARDDSLTVEIRDQHEMTIEVITLACAGECADIIAVAHGGNPPYAFRWEDGSSEPRRHVCPQHAEELTVSATDTEITGAEFGRRAQTTSASVSARVLDCSDAGPPPSADGGGLCVKNPSIEGAAFPDVPPDWAFCQNTPDINPVGAASAASDGVSYLAASASLSESGVETFQATLCQPIAAGVSHALLIDLMMSSAWGYPGRAHLQIWGASTSCEKDALLWMSPLIDNQSAWKTFCLTLTAAKAYSYLILVPTILATDPSEVMTAGGYLAVDNLRPTETCN